MLKVILVCIIACSGYYAWAIFPINHGAGILAPEPPHFERITREKPFSFKGSTIKPLKKVSGEIRIVEKERYFFDKRSEFSPIDVIVGWDQLSDERNLNHLYFSMSERFYELNYSKPPLPIEEIINQTNFWHLVPSSEKVEKKMKSLRKGNVIVLKGLVVDIESDTDFDWRSELSISDKKELTSLIIWVSELKVL